MKIEEVISSTIMFVVSGLVLIGFTIAWFTNMKMGPTVTGVQLEAAKMGDVKVALTSGGKDISELEAPDCYAKIEFDKYLDVDSNGKKELAPGTCGKVTFYVTPTSSNVRACEIVPSLMITDGNDWYPEHTEDSEETGDNESGNDSGDDSNASEWDAAGLYEIAQRHIEFYTDSSMTEDSKITEDNVLDLEWTVDDWDSEKGSMKEKAVTIYWKWHYEYPFSTDQETLIRKYDEEDMKLGNNISGMKFYFTFTAR